MILLDAQGTYFGVAYNAKYGICAKNQKNQLVFATNVRSNVLLNYSENIANTCKICLSIFSCNYSE